MNLEQLKQNLNEANLITNEESSSVKGGLRYETYSYSKFIRKVGKLNRKGISPSCRVSGGHYCIEW